MQVGQPVRILNSDPTLHNVHALAKANQEFNTGQPIQGMKFNHTFTAKEVMVPFKCDVHGWMNAIIVVEDNPYDALTDANGSFKITDVPPGKYTVKVWHSKLGEQTKEVTVGPKEEVKVAFEMKAP